MEKNNNKKKENDLSEINIKRESYISILLDFQNDLTEIVFEGLNKDKEFEKLEKLISDIQMNVKSLNKSVSEPFKAAVLGEQGVGKSTLINLLIEEKLMPESYNENEAAIIKTVYTEDIALNKTAKIYFFADKSGNQKTENLTYDELLNLVDLNKSKALLEDPKYKDKVEYFEIFSSNNNLKDVQIINTPGVNVLTSNFYEKVRHLFKEADIIIWVFSKNNMLNKFNKERINEIYKDNKNIIGILSKSDSLFGQDPESGVKDAIEQFLNEIENGILFRVKRNDIDLISLFPYNGEAAMIATGFKNKDLIADIDNIEAQEEKELRMLWNYVNLGYPYICEGKDFRLDFNLYTPSNAEIKDSDKIFDCKLFLSELLNNKFVEKIKNNETNYKIIYTEKGKELLIGCSQLFVIDDFANNYIFSKELIDKLNNVKDKFDLFYADDNKLSELESIRLDFEDKLKKLNNDFDNERNNLEQRIKDLSDEYKEWSDNRLSIIVKEKGTVLINEILSRMENEIDRSDMANEIWNIIKSKFGGEREGPAIKQIQKICEESILKIIDESLDDITNDALEEIDNIMILLEYEGESIESIKVDVPLPNKQIKIKKPIPKINVTKIIQKLKPILKSAIVKLAQKDLRKRMPQLLKKMIKMLRVLLKKIGINFAKKQAAKTASEVSMGPWGWVFLVVDIVQIGKSIYDMLGDMKRQIKDDLEDNNADFTNSLRDIFIRVFSDILNETIKKIREELKIDDVKVTKLQNALNIISQVNSIFLRYQNSLK